MLVPINMAVPEGPPTALHVKLTPALKAIVISQGIVAICRAIVGDVWGCFCDLMIVAMGYLAVREANIMYILWYGISCFFNCLFDMIHVVVRFLKYKADFFNSEDSFIFNLHSFALLAAAILCALGATMCYTIYRDYERQNRGFGEAAPFAQQDFGPNGGYYTQRLRAYDGGTSSHAAAAANFTAFSGAGHRLDGCDTSDSPYLPPAGTTGQCSALRAQPKYEDFSKYC